MNEAIDQLKSAIKAILPRSQIVLVGSFYYNEQTSSSDYDLLVLSTFPVRKSKQQAIVTRMADAKIEYDIHFIPKLFVCLNWKLVAGRDLDTGRDIRLRMTTRVRSTIRSTRIRMAYYYYLTQQYNKAVIELLRVRLLPYAESDVDLFSYAGKQQLLERLRRQFDEDEYQLYKSALNNRSNTGGQKIDTRLLIEKINQVFQGFKDDLFQLQHNLQYYAYSLKRGSLNPLVNYNKAITAALFHFANGELDESARQLSKLTKVTQLDEQLKEYALLSVLTIEN
jgi:predicted nucleotidyltransferase